MTLRVRKLMVLGLVGAVLLLGNAVFVATWLQEHGVVDWAVRARSRYLTGTTLAIIVVLLILLVPARSAASRIVRRCPVCDHVLLGRGSYCSECGSKT